jgi:hypothetical protein
MSTLGHPTRRPNGVAFAPVTRLGRWAVVLAVAAVGLVALAAIVPRGASIGFAAGIGAGVSALVAIVRDRERAVSVFAALVPLVIAVAFGLAELISG